MLIPVILYEYGSIKISLGDVFVGAAALISAKKGDYRSAATLASTQFLFKTLLTFAPDTPYRMVAVNFVALSGMMASQKFIDDTCIIESSWSHVLAWQVHVMRSESLKTMILYEIFGQLIASSERIYARVQQFVDEVVHKVHTMNETVESARYAKLVREANNRLNKLAPLRTKALPANEGDLVPFDYVCSICTSEIDDVPHRVLPCRHAFCQEHIDTWMVQHVHDECPFCKTNIATSFADVIMAGAAAEGEPAANAAEEGEPVEEEPVEEEPVEGMTINAVVEPEFEAKVVDVD